MPEADRFAQAIEILKETGYTWQQEPVIDPASRDPVVTPGVGLTMPNGQLVPAVTLLAPAPGFDPYRTTFAIWIGQWLEEIGVSTTVDTTDFDSTFDAVFPPQTEESAQAWDLYVLGWRNFDVSLPGTSLVAFFHSREDVVTGGGFNTTGYQSPRFDEVADAFEAATDVNSAADLTKEMDLIIAGDLPYVVLFRTQIVEVYSSKVEFPTDVIMGGHSGFANAWPSAVRIEN